MGVPCLHTACCGCNRVQLPGCSPGTEDAVGTGASPVQGPEALFSLSGSWGLSLPPPLIPGQRFPLHQACTAAGPQQPWQRLVFPLLLCWVSSGASGSSIVQCLGLGCEQLPAELDVHERGN